MDCYQYAYNLLRDLIRIKSPFFHEHEIAEYVHDYMKKTGVLTIRQKVRETKNLQYECDNIIGYVDAGKEDTLLINAHMDTVFVTEGWKYDPYDATLIEDKVYGLGSADMKGGLTLLLLVLKDTMERISEGKEPKTNIVFLASVDEEGPYSLGAKTFVNSEYAKKITCGLVLESSKGISKNTSPFPTILYGAKGCYLYNIKIIGKSTHAADPEGGTNAIDAMCKILEIINKVPLEHSRDFNKPINNVLWINGGQKALSTPEKCEILVDFHITPAEDKKLLKEKIIDAITPLNLGVDVEVELMRDCSGFPMVYQPYLLSKDNPYLKKLRKSCKDVLGLGDCSIDTSICVGDFNHFNEAGIPTMVLGPDGGDLHFKNEYVKLSDIIQLKKVLIDFIFSDLSCSYRS